MKCCGNCFRICEEKASMNIHSNALSQFLTLLNSCSPKRAINGNEEERREKFKNAFLFFPLILLKRKRELILLIRCTTLSTLPVNCEKGKSISVWKAFFFFDGNLSVQTFASPSYFGLPLVFYPALRKGFSTLHYGTKPGHFETSKIHFPLSEGVSEVSERANE